MRKTKKWLAALLAAALLVSTAACGSPSSSGSSSESSKGSSSASSAVSQEGSEPSTADVSDAEPGWKQHEMCIRDRLSGLQHHSGNMLHIIRMHIIVLGVQFALKPVSYTHLAGYFFVAERP